jgi:hypothetical protein
MAAPVPKPKEQRRNRHPPARGEWVDLEPLDEPILREYDPIWDATLLLDEDGEPRAQSPRGVRRRMWEAWRISPVTSQYGPEDIAAIEELAEHFYALTPADQDRRMNALGLTPKGKRDLRWRTPNEVKTLKKAEEKASPVRRLRALSPDNEEK